MDINEKESKSKPTHKQSFFQNLFSSLFGGNNPDAERKK